MSAYRLKSLITIRTVYGTAEEAIQVAMAIELGLDPTDVVIVEDDDGNKIVEVCDGRVVQWFE